MIRVLRWALLVPATVAAWYGVFLMGARTYRHAELSWCPPEDLVSEFCNNLETRYWLGVLVHIFIGLSAIAVVVSSVLIAPTSKERVAWLTLATGLMVVGYFGLMASTWFLFGSAGIPGTLGALAIAWFLRGATPNPALKADVAKAARP